MTANIHTTATSYPYPYPPLPPPLSLLSHLQVHSENAHTGGGPASGLGIVEAEHGFGDVEAMGGDLSFLADSAGLPLRGGQVPRPQL